MTLDIYLALACGSLLGFIFAALLINHLVVNVEAKAHELVVDSLPADFRSALGREPGIDEEMRWFERLNEAFQMVRDTASTNRACEVCGSFLTSIQFLRLHDQNGLLRPLVRISCNEELCRHRGDYSTDAWVLASICFDDEMNRFGHLEDIEQLGSDATFGFERSDEPEQLS